MQDDGNDLPDLSQAEVAWERFENVPSLVDVVRTLLHENPAYLREFQTFIVGTWVTHVVGIYGERTYRIAGHRQRSADGRLVWTSIRYAAPCDPIEWHYTGRPGAMQ